MKSRLIYIGYNLTNSNLETESLISGEIKNANYLLKHLKTKDALEVLPLSINLWPMENEKKVDNYINKSKLKGIFRWLDESIKINRILNDIKKDGDILYLTIPSYLPFINRKLFKKIIVTAHGTYWPELMADLKYQKNIAKKMLHYLNGLAQLLIDRYSFRKADLLHSVSEYQVREMIKTYAVQKEKIFVLRNGTDFVNTNAQEKCYEIGWVGRLAKKKNIGLLLSFINLIDFKSAFICSGNNYFSIDNESELIIEELKKNNKIYCVQNINDKELNKALSKTKCLLVTSTGYESIPTVIYEALASGCYVIAPDSWGVCEVEGSGIVTYEEGNLDSLARAYNLIKSSELIEPAVDESVRWNAIADKFLVRVLA